MSKPAPGKPNYLSTFLFAIAAFMLFQMWFGPKQNQNVVNGKEIKTSAEALTELKRIDALEPKTYGEANANNDEAFNKVLPTYKRLVEDEVKAKALTRAQADAQVMQATLITAHVQLKSGIATNDTNKLRMAYNGLEHYNRTEGSKPSWNQETVELTEKGAPTTTTGAAFYTRLIEALSDRNKTDYIWGFIPGGYQFIDSLVGLTGRNPGFSYAFATFLLAFVVRAVVFPLSQKQLMTSRQMSQLAPRLAEIKEKFKDEPTEMNRRSMELYGRYGINPFSGCLPALVQMPLFLTVYQCMVHYQFEFTKGTFLWINPATSDATHGFLARDLGQLDYPLIAIYGITMVISTLLTPVNDPTQARQQRIIGLVAAVLFPVMMCFRWFPVVSGFVLYWTFTNLFSMAQSLRAYRMPMPPLVEVNAPGGGVFPGGGKPKGRWAQMMEEMQKAAEEQQRAGREGKGDSDGGTTVRNPKPKTPDAPKGAGKLSPSRPVGESPSANGSTGAPAKHKPKKRK